MIDQGRLKEMMNYDSATGIFTRKVRNRAFAAGSIAGTTNKDGYIHMMIDGKVYKAHRLAWLYVYGRFPVDQIDHKNGKRDDNRIDNLREVDSEGNSHNLHHPREGNISKMLGVTFRKKSGKYQARIIVKYKDISLGFFATAELAHQAYLEAKRTLHPTSTI